MPSWLESLKSFLVIGYAPHIDPLPSGPYVNDREAYLAADRFARLQPDCSVEVTSGTPSMVPLIPPQPTSVVVQKIKFSAVRLGTVVVYRSTINPGGIGAHRLVDGNAEDGYIPSGDNNPRSEPFNRVTEATLIGEIIAIFTYAPPPPPGLPVI